MADRNPGSHKVASDAPVDTQAGCTNKSNGLNSTTADGQSNIDLMAIPPNKPRPIETTKTHWLFGNFGD